MRVQARSPRTVTHRVGTPSDGYAFWSIMWDKNRVFKAATEAEAEEWVQVRGAAPPRARTR